MTVFCASWWIYGKKLTRLNHSHQALPGETRVPGVYFPECTPLELEKDISYSQATGKEDAA
jgi:hypothetical protein